MAEAIAAPRERTYLLPLLYEEHRRSGWLTPDAVGTVAAHLRIPLAEAWEVATSFPDFRFEPPDGLPARCLGLSCVLNGATPAPTEAAVDCQFRCYDAPAPGHEAPPTEAVIRRAGPLLAPFAGVPGETVHGLSTEQALAAIDSSGLRGRGGAYFPTGRKWRAALDEGRPVALVVNAEEGEPGIFKDRVLLSLRLERFLDGLAIAQHVLRPELCIIFVNGEARDIIASLEARLAEPTLRLPVEPRIIAGGGGYVLGEESTMLNAIEGRKPVPRLRPPYPVESGLFGMPTVINNAETIAQLSVVFQHGPAEFARVGTAEAPGTKLFCISGRVPRPGLYEAPLGSSVAEVIEMAGAPLAPPLRAVLCGGPSGGFLPPAELHRPLLPGPLHHTGAIAGSGGLIVLDSTSDLRQAAIAMADYNARESCGKCTPCREGAPRLVDALESRDHRHLDDLLEVVGAASLCGLGQMAPGPIRSAMHFWPEAFA